MRMLTLALLFVVAACHTAEDLYDPAVARSVVLDIAEDSMPADGDAATMVSVTLEPRGEDPNAPRYVTFHTTAGKFVADTGPSSTVRAAVDSIGATARLVAPTESGTAEITAYYGTSTDLGTVKLFKALPEALRISHDSFALEAGPQNTLSLNAHLERARGSVSESVSVEWSAVDSLGTSLGRFVSTEAPQPGMTSARYTTGPTGYRGPVRIAAAAAGAETVVADTTVVWIVDP